MNINFVCVLMILCFFDLYAGAPRRKGKSGPYITRLISAHKCHNPKPPYLNVTNSTVEVELYNTSSKTNLVRANITVGYVYKNLMGKAKQYKWVNGKWKLNLVMQSDQCNGPIGMWFKILALEFSTDQCAIPIGHYYIKDLDANTIQHALVPTTEYGKVLWRIEVFISWGMLGCFEYETLVVPAP